MSPPTTKTLRLAALASLLIPLASEAKNAEAADPNFLWKVTAPNGHSLHLFGSIHMADASVYPLARPIEDAFAQSDVLVVEADIEATNAGDIARLTLQKAALPQGETLSQTISPKTWALLEKASNGLLPAALFEPFQPWYAAMTLAAQATQKTGLDPKYGLDRHFLLKRGARKVVELEGLQAQIELLAGFTLAEQERFLVWTLNDLDSLEDELARLLSAWKRGDDAHLDELMTKATRKAPETKAFMEAFIDKRNAAMAKKLEAMLKTPEKEFVVVGAAHLVGETGLVRALSRKGYRVERL